jgi:polysaccharide biosynthesis/export protein
MAAIAAAGGITRNADISKVIIKRRLPGRGMTTLTYNLWDSVNTDQIPEDLALQDGDTIAIPKLEANATVDRRLVARSSLAANTVRVRVVGEVKQPGEVQVPPDGSLSSAIAIAGGPTNDSKLSEVTFVRVNDQGATEQKKVDLSKLDDQMQVQDGDVLMVPKQPAARALDTASRVVSPLGILLRLLTGL